MDHREIRERLEVAAVEPGGLDRIVAGDTPESAAIAGHLAGCVPCLNELDRLRRAASIVQSVVADEAVDLPAELRARTLSYVHELGVARPRQPAPGRSSRPAAWVAAIAAAVVIAVLATAALVGGGGGSAGSVNATAAIDATELANIATWTVRIAAAPDARQIGLASAAGGIARGSLTYSASSGSLVVIADGLAPAPAGKEYRCWLETAAGRARIGRMYVARNIAYWVGSVANLGSYAPGTRFGVSLEDLGGVDVGGPAVLSGSL